MKPPKRIFLYVVFLTLLLGITLPTLAFIGPSAGQNPGSGSGLFNVDANRNVGFGTSSSTPVSTFNATSTESGPSGFGYVFMVASTTNPGLGLKNLTSGNTYVWSSRNFGNLQLYRESATLPGYVVLDINQYGDMAIGQKATSTGGVARLFVGGNIQSSGSFIGSFSGNISAANVSGPSAFGTNYGTYNYAAPGAFAIGTSTTSGLPASGLYVGGNVGIGTLSPGQKLEVVGDARLGTGASLANDYGKSLYFSVDATPVDVAGIRMKEHTTDNYGLEFQTYSGSLSTKMTILGNGNVGIGTSTPGDVLEVVKTGASGGIIVAPTGANSQAQIILKGRGGGAEQYSTAWLASSNGTLRLGGSASLEILDGGAPNSGNYIARFIGSSHEFDQYNTSNVLTNVLSTSGSSYLTGGNVGIATTTPGSPLTVAGVVYSSTGGFKFPDGTTQTTAFAGASQSLSAANVTGPAAFGTNLGTYSYAFPSALAIGTTTTSGLPANGLYVGGNVGIGTTAPGYKLQINGGTNGGGDVPLLLLASNGGSIGDGTGIRFESAAGAANYATIIATAPGSSKTGLTYTTGNGGNHALMGGNVGIGTTGPVAKLEISSAGSSLNQFVRLNDTSASGKTYALINRLNDTAGLFSVYDITANASRMAIDTNGNVGIATTTPGSKLTVAGNGLVTGDFTVNGTMTATAFSGPLAGSLSAANVTGPSAFGTNYGTYNYAAPGAFAIGTTTTTGLPTNGLLVTGTTTLATVAGNVGIGTTNPTFKLTVDGSVWFKNGVGANGFQWDPTGSGNAGSLDMFGHIGMWGGTISGINSFLTLRGSTGSYGIDFQSFTSGSWNSKMRILDSGNVGIGTSTPVSILNVNSNADNGNPTLTISGGTGSGSNVGQISFSSNSGLAEVARIQTIRDTANNKGALGLFTSDGTLTERIRISNTGNVGIGTSTPASKLSVAGNIYTSGHLFGQSFNTPNAIFLIGVNGIASDGFVEVGDNTTGRSNGIKFYPGGGVAMTIASSSNVGIATTTPQGKLVIAGQYYSAEVAKGNSGAALTIDWSAGNTQHVILNAATVTFTFTNGQPGGRYTLILKQDATGGRVVSWPASVRWGGAGQPTLSAAANITDYVGFLYNGVDAKYDGLAFTANF